MSYIDIVAVLAIVQYIVFSFMVGQARSRYGVKAPAVSGHEMFERAYRVQMNTLELLVALLPGLYLAAHYWPARFVVPCAAVYLLGRTIYWRAYSRDPASRSLGFLLSILPVTVLLGSTLVGAALKLA